MILLSQMNTVYQENYLTFCRAWSKTLQCKWLSRHSYKLGKICTHLQAECKRRAPTKCPVDTPSLHCSHCSLKTKFTHHSQSPHKVIVYILAFIRLKKKKIQKYPFASCFSSCGPLYFHFRHLLQGLSHHCCP